MPYSGPPNGPTERAVAQYWLSRGRAQARAARMLRTSGPGALPEALVLGLTAGVVALLILRLV
jgi:hypothetical protein